MSEKLAILFVDYAEGRKLLGEGSCSILKKVTMKETACRHNGYFLDCRSCNIPMLYPEIAQRLIVEKLR